MKLKKDSFESRFPHLPDPSRTISEDIQLLVTGLIFQYYIVYQRFIKVAELNKILYTHPSIKNNKDYNFYFIVILGKYHNTDSLYLDSNYNIVTI